MKRALDRICLRSARASRVGDRALAIADFSCCASSGDKEDFGEGAEISRRAACAPQNFRFATRSTRST
jgi:hypothetical protein